MATHKIGKLKFNLSKHGFAYRWGEGDIKRLAFGKGTESGDDRADSGAPTYPYDEDGGYYDDPRADDSDYNADEYAPEGGYYDEEYDAYDEEGGYYDENEPRMAAGPVMEYVENNTWVVLALLIALPPLGIYLLWRLNRYDFRLRAGLSAASAVWFIVLLVLIFSNLFGGGSDASKLPQMTLVTGAPTAAPTVDPSVEPSAEPSAEPGTDQMGLNDLDDAAEPDASPTPRADLGDAQTGQTGDSSLVYSPQTGLYYHSDPNCTNIDPGVAITAMTVAAARNRSQTACPVCVGAVDDTIYYATKTGKNYHTDKFCQGMKGAVPYTKAQAEAEGKPACPICAGGVEKNTSTKTDDSKKSAAEKYLESIKNDKSGVHVYMTTGGKNYHTDKNCQGMSGAKRVTLLAALKSGKPACSVCASGYDKMVYATQNGKSYHIDPNCQNMKNAKHITLASALVLGKKKCNVCITDSFYTEKEEATGSEVYVYATKSGKYYHTNSACTGMTGAEKVTLLSMLKEGRPACPTCASSADRTVYASVDGKYYHSYATCSGMKNAKKSTLATAIALGYKACDKCWTSADAGGSGAVNDDRDDGNAGYSGVYVYATENGKNYHTKANCSKAEKGATKVLLEQAIDDGKTACQTCAKSADEIVYGQKGNKYYHKKADCSGMTKPVKGTVAQALINGLKKCPICFETDTGSASANKYKSGASGIDVYATAAGKNYHTKSSCSKIKGSPIKITLETALNYGKTACSVCASSGNKTAYATKGGKYYHFSSSCAGSSASKGTLDQALAYGLKPCPNCATGAGETPKDSGKFVSGKSGVKVYAKAGDKYFHMKSDCGGLSGAKYVTLETALNYGMKACPDCAALAAKTVYAASGSKNYHYDKSCAGSGAVSGTLGEALAYGLKACPICVTGEEGGAGGGEESSAPGDTKVYIDLSGEGSYLYHKSANCSDVGMKKGTAVTLKYAIEQGYGDCGFCNPPTSVSD